MNDLHEQLQQLPPGRVIVRGYGWSLDCGSFFAQAARAARELDRLQLEEGARVAVYAQNSLSCLLLLWALWSRGHVAVLINRRWPKAQVSELMMRLQCRAVFADCASEWGPGVRGVPVCPMPPVVHGPIPSSLLHENGTIPLPDISRPATIMFTTGSTGIPKALEHRLESHLLSAEGSNANLPFEEGDGWLLSLPLYHVGGLSIFFRALLGGGAVCLCDRPETALRNLPGMTHVSIVPTQLGRWLREPDLLASLKGMKAMLLGGASAPVSLIRECMSLDLPLYTTYGSTEMCSQITTTSRCDSAEHWYSSGKLLPHRALKIDDRSRIWVGGPLLFTRILSLEPNQVDRPAPEWFRTGDLGRLDDYGYLHVLGREDNMFISGGENISPEEIESAIMTLPGVVQALVVSVRDDEYGFRPAAFIKFAHGLRPDLRALCATLKEKIARYKIPDYCLPWPEDPPARGGKLDREGFRIKAERIIEANGLTRPVYGS